MPTLNERDRRDLNTDFLEIWFIAEIYLFHLGNPSCFYVELYYLGGNNQ